MVITIVQGEDTVFEAGGYQENREENWYLFVWVPAFEGQAEYTGFMGPFYSATEAEEYALLALAEGEVTFFDA